MEDEESVIEVATGRSSHGESNKNVQSNDVATLKARIHELETKYQQLHHEKSSVSVNVEEAYRKMRESELRSSRLEGDLNISVDSNNRLTEENEQCMKAARNAEADRVAMEEWKQKCLENAQKAKDLETKYGKAVSMMKTTFSTSLENAKKVNSLEEKLKQSKIESRAVNKYANVIVRLLADISRECSDVLPEGIRDRVNQLPINDLLQMTKPNAAIEEEDDDVVSTRSSSVRPTRGRGRGRGSRGGRVAGRTVSLIPRWGVVDESMHESLPVAAGEQQEGQRAGSNGKLVESTKESSDKPTVAKPVARPYTALENEMLMRLEKEREKASGRGKSHSVENSLDLGFETAADDATEMAEDGPCSSAASSFKSSSSSKIVVMQRVIELKDGEEEGAPMSMNKAPLASSDSHEKSPSVTERAKSPVKTTPTRKALLSKTVAKKKTKTVEDAEKEKEDAMEMDGVVESTEDEGPPMLSPQNRRSPRTHASSATSAITQRDSVKSSPQKLAVKRRSSPVKTPVNKRGAGGGEQSGEGQTPLREKEAVRTRSNSAKIARENGEEDESSVARRTRSRRSTSKNTSDGAEMFKTPTTTPKKTLKTTKTTPKTIPKTPKTKVVAPPPARAPPKTRSSSTTMVEPAAAAAAPTPRGRTRSKQNSPAAPAVATRSSKRTASALNTSAAAAAPLPQPDAVDDDVEMSHNDEDAADAAAPTLRGRTRSKQNSPAAPEVATRSSKRTAAARKTSAAATAPTAAAPLPDAVDDDVEMSDDEEDDSDADIDSQPLTPAETRMIAALLAVCREEKEPREAVREFQASRMTMQALVKCVCKALMELPQSNTWHAMISCAARTDRRSEDELSRGEAARVFPKSEGLLFQVLVLMQDSARKKLATLFTCFYEAYCRQVLASIDESQTTADVTRSMRLLFYALAIAERRDKAAEARRFFLLILQKKSSQAVLQSLTYQLCHIASTASLASAILCTKLDDEENGGRLISMHMNNKKDAEVLNWAVDLVNRPCKRAANAAFRTPATIEMVEGWWDADMEIVESARNHPTAVTVDSMGSLRFNDSTKKLVLRMSLLVAPQFRIKGLNRVNLLAELDKPAVDVIDYATAPGDAMGASSSISRRSLNEREARVVVLKMHIARIAISALYADHMYGPGEREALRLHLADLIERITGILERPACSDDGPTSSRVSLDLSVVVSVLHRWRDDVSRLMKDDEEMMEEVAATNSSTQSSPVMKRTRREAVTTNDL